MKTELLIEAVYKRPQLWDQNNGSYNNRAVVDRIWQDVAEELKEKKELVKKKWRHLRDQFRAELKKKPADPSDDADAEVEIISWPYFNLMLFLKDHMRRRQPYCLLGRKERRGSLSTNSLQPSDDDEQKYTDDMKQHENIHQDDTDEDSTIYELPLKKPTNMKSKNTRANNEQSEILKIKKRKLELLEQQHKAARIPRDEDESFFDSLIPHVKRLLPLQKLNFRMQTQAILIDLLHKNLQQQPGMTQTTIVPSIFSTSLTPPPNECQRLPGLTHTFSSLNQTSSTLPMSFPIESVGQQGDQNSVLYIQDIYK